MKIGVVDVKLVSTLGTVLQFPLLDLGDLLPELDRALSFQLLSVSRTLDRVIDWRHIP